MFSCARFVMTVTCSFDESFIFGDAIVTMCDEKFWEQQNYLCPPDRRRPNPLRVYSDKQCSTLVDNVLSRYACKQCCDVQHVGLGCVRSCLWLATSVPLRLRSLCSGKVPDVGSSVYVFRKGSRCFGFPTFCRHVFQMNFETKP